MMLDGYRLVDLNGGLRGSETMTLSAGWIGERRGRHCSTALVHGMRHQMVLADAATVRALAPDMSGLEAVCRGQDGLNRHEGHNERRYELKEPLHLRRTIRAPGGMIR